MITSYNDFLIETLDTYYTLSGIAIDSSLYNEDVYNILALIDGDDYE